MKPDLEAIRKRLEMTSEWPWEYGGMIGDPGKPLRHFVQNKAGKIILLSEDFAVDYAGLEKDLILSAHAPTDIAALLEYVEELERATDAVAVAALRAVGVEVKDEEVPKCWRRRKEDARV